jgi:membrane-associated phospholipid phosphatase
MIAWDHITMFGDSVVTLPAAAAILIWLLAGRAWQMALCWAWLFGAGLALVVATKVAFIGWGIGISAIDFAGISGHSMRAAAILPVLCYLLLHRSMPAIRNGGVLIGLLLAALIAVSRVAVGAHSVSEAVSGLVLGNAIGLGFIYFSQPLTKPRVNRWLVAFSFFGLLPTSYAEPAPTNYWIEAMALYLSGHDRPYVRDTRYFAVVEGET